MRFLEEKHGFKQDNLNERLLCLSQNLHGSNKRKKTNTQRDPFTNELTKIMNLQIDNAQAILDKTAMNINISFYKRKLS